jgi:hypothetical protein
MPRSKEELIKSAREHSEKAKELRKKIIRDTFTILAKRRL